jgi:flagellar basal-body rod modification protein FlgD
MAIDSVRPNSGLSGNVAAGSPSMPQSDSANGLKKNDPNQKSFAEVWDGIQAKFGGKDEKPRDIKKNLDKDDFLRIMVTQLRHQDPTKPMEADKMAAEMAQITSVEQMHNVNQTLGRLADQYRANDKAAMANMIGRSVTVDRNRFTHEEQGKETLSFNLKQDASSVKLLLLSETGETVLEKDLGAQKAGENSFYWDGKKGNLLPAKAGLYQYRIEAKAPNGQTVQAETQVRAKVVGVNYEGAEAALLVGDSKHTDKVMMKSVIKVENDAAPVANSPQNAASFNAPAAASGNPTPAGMFTFEKGVGSKPMDSADLAKLAPEVQAVIEKGFPNGLSGSNEPSSGPNESLGILTEKGGNSK